MKKSWLNGKTVIISGASGGLGFSVAKKLIDTYGCKIIGITRNEDKIKKAAASLGDLSRFFSYEIFDVSDKNNWENFYKKLNANGIIPDILINNAGIMLPFSKFEYYSDKEIEETVNTNFTAVVYSVKYILPLLKKSNAPSIINISSAAGLCSVIGQSMYTATKFAVHGFTESLIEEYRKKIYVAGVYPGFIKTDILRRIEINEKESKTVSRFMMPLDKATKKITRAIHKKRKRIVLGIDGKFMSFFARLFPRFTPKIIAQILKKSKLEIFNNVFENKKEN